MSATPGLTIVGFYAGLNGLILLWLAVHVGLVRQRLAISIGDGGAPALLRAMRGQANFVEYVPLILVLLGLLAALAAPLWLLHLLGLALTLGRLLHGLHFTREDAPAWQRAAGAGLSLLVLCAGSLALLASTLSGIF
jgi:uncharacterized protein